MTVAFGTKVVENQGVEWVVRLLEVAAVKRDSNKFSLLSLGVLEGAHTITGVNKVLGCQYSLTSNE
jgi:hypothetical protein